MSRNIELNWFEEIPKVELHLHLEGAIPLDAMWNLVQKYGGDTKVSSKELLKQKFIFRDFKHFIETWIWKNQFLREYEDFTYIAKAVGQDLVRQNIQYVEIFFSPPDFRRQGLKTQRITEAIHQGFEEVEDLEAALVADLVRDFGAEQGEITLAEINEVKHLGVIGVGIGGSEKEFPPEAFEVVFSRARQLGFRTSAHAGEAAGSESIWGAINKLKVDRIGHGTRAIEDENLMDYLVEHKIPIELCPMSNVKTGVVKSYKAHPVRLYFERGVVLSINTDDPMMFGNSLAEEYRLLAEKKGFSKTEIKALVLSGIEMAWMPEERKKQMITAFQSDLAWSK